MIDLTSSLLGGVMTFSPIQKRFYEGSYAAVLNAGFIGKLQNMVHRLLERDLRKRYYSSIFEFGAGNLEHLKYTKLDYSRYVASDIRLTKSSIRFLVKENPNLNFHCIELLKVDAQKPNNLNEKFDLILATCVLIHLRDPESAVSTWKKMLKDSAEIAIYVPCEPGLLLRLGRFLFIKRKHRQNGILNSDLLYAREHLTSFVNCNTYIKEVFADFDIKVRYWPFWFIKSWNLNIFAIFTVYRDGS